MAGGLDVRGHRSEQCREEGILVSRDLESLETLLFRKYCSFYCRLGKQRYLLYVAAQLLGAICGSALLRLSLPPSYLDTPFVTAGSATAAHPIQVFILEFMCTFVLVYVVFATVVDKAGAAKVLNPPTPPYLFTLCFCTPGTLRRSPHRYSTRWNICHKACRKFL